MSGRVPITERLMQAGSWTLNLDPDIPKELRSQLTDWGHVYVYDGELVRPGLGDAAMIAMARWGGILRGRPNRFAITGVNMIAHLGDEDGKGSIVESKIGGAGTPSLLSTYVGALVGPGKPCIAVNPGTVTAGGATHDPGYQWLTVRAAFDSMMEIWGAEYLVRKDCTVDVALIGSSAIFQQVPTAIAVRRSSGKDNTLTGLRVTQLEVESDSDDYITRAIVVDSVGGHHGANGAASPFTDLFGNALKIAAIIDSSNTPAASANGVAARLVAARQVAHTQVTLQSDDYDIPKDVIAGDWIWVYDASGDLVDIANQVWYRGRFYPVKLRVMAITWPVESGMSVWYRDNAGGWLDLTRYVLKEPPGVTFEVGSMLRRLTKT